MIGKKDVKAELVYQAEEPDRQTPDRESFQQLPITTPGTPPAQYTLPRRQGIELLMKNFFIDVFFVTSLCLFFL